MKILKLFLKDCFLNFWGALSIVLNLISIFVYYSDFFKELSYMPTIIYVLNILCVFTVCYRLYYKVSCEYPDILIKNHKNIEFEDFCSFFKLDKMSKKIKSRYKIYIKEDENSLIVGDCCKNYVKLKLFNKININNATTNIIELLEPNINLVSVNNISDKFFIDRLQISLRKIKFTKERYLRHYEYIPVLKEDMLCKFPYKINPKENISMFLYIEIDIYSDDENSFNELLEWLRNIDFKINIPLTEGDKEFIEKYNMKYNFKCNLIKNLINKKIESEEELYNILSEN